MKKIFRFFAANHLLAYLITFMTIIAGLFTYMDIRRDVFPNVNYGISVITTRYPGASPEDVELNVTNKIEDEIQTVSNIDKVFSVSMENISVVIIKLDPNYSDHDEIMNDVREAVGRISDFPVEVTESPHIMEVETGEFAVLEIGLAGDIPYHELRKYAKQFEKKLQSLSGVSTVKSFGYLAREIEVQVDPAQIKKYQIPLHEIIAAIQQRNIRATGGSFESYTSEKNLMTLAQFKNPMEVGDVIVRSSFDGPLIKVKDLAVIKDDFEDERILSRMNGIPAISYQVTKKDNADVIRMVKAIRKLADEEAAFLPDGVQILFSSDFSKIVEKRFDVVQTNGIIGLILVLIMLAIFLNLRSAIWVAMGIPITLLGTLFLMPMFGASLDTISMAAMIIIIGIIVDDGIIIAENIQRHREEGAIPLDAAVNGLSEVFTPVVTTILTTFLAFAPMFLMTGIMGSFIFVIPLVITLALFISLFEAVVALPAHLIGGKVKKKKIKKSWFRALEKPFNKIIRVVLKLRHLYVLATLGLFIGTMFYAYNHVRFELFPASMAEKFFILMELPTGSSLQATSEKVKDVEKLVMQLPSNELASYVTRIGNQEPYPAAGFPPGENENWAYISADLTPYTERERMADVIVESLREKTDKIEGFEIINYYVEDGGPPIGKAITLRVVSSDDNLRNKLADSIVTYMKTMPDVKDIIRNDRTGKDQVNIKINYNKLARLGLTVADIAQNVRIAYDGEVVTSVRYGDEDVDFRVLFLEEVRKEPELLKEFLIPNNRGRLIPLKEVATLETTPGPSNFFHFDDERAVTITADIEKDGLTSIEATTQIDQHFNVGKNWHGARLLIGGVAEETEKSMNSLYRAFWLAIIGILFLLIILFNSTTQPFIVISAIPFGIMGVIIAFALHNEPLGFIAMLGVIGLMGVIVNDALVLVVHINNLKKQRPDDSILSIVADGTTNRLRAVLLTTLTTVVGMLPLAYGIGGSDPYIGPMALALGYGLLFATPITLGLVPSLFVIFDDIRRLFTFKKKPIEQLPNSK